MIEHLPSFIPNLTDWKVTITQRSWNGKETHFVDLMTFDDSYRHRVPFTDKGEAYTYFQHLSSEVLKRSHN